MGRVYERIPAHYQTIIENHPLFFVATAPNDSQNGHVNLSPKSSNGGLIMLDDHTLAFLDLTGSGSETSSHVMQNKRITLMLMNTEPNSAPLILRFYGSASILFPNELTMEMKNKFNPKLLQDPGFRAVFVVDVHRIQTSCGYSVPYFEFKGNRNTLIEWVNSKVKQNENGLIDYQIEKNSFSIDGQPSLAQHTNYDKVEKQQIHAVFQDGFYYGKLMKVNDNHTEFLMNPWFLSIKQKLKAMQPKYREQWIVPFWCGVVTSICLTKFIQNLK